MPSTKLPIGELWELEVLHDALSQIREELLDSKDVTTVDPTLTSWDDFMSTIEIYNSHLDVIERCLDAIKEETYVRAKRLSKENRGRRRTYNALSALRGRLRAHVRDLSATRKHGHLGGDADSSDHE